MAAEPGSDATNLKLRPVLSDLKEHELENVRKWVQAQYATNDKFRFSMWYHVTRHVRFKVLLHPSLKAEAVHPSRARVLSRLVTAIMNIKAGVNADGALVVTTVADGFEQRNQDSFVYSVSLVSLVERRLREMNVSPELPELSKLRIILSTVLEQATAFYQHKAHMAVMEQST